VREIVGRNEHVPVFRNARDGEDFISPHIVNEFFVPGLRRFQMRVEDATSFVFSICLDSGLGPERRAATLAAIEQRWREILAEKQHPGPPPCEGEGRNSSHGLVVPSRRSHIKPAKGSRRRSWPGPRATIPFSEGVP
jgi:hypothetical protein